MHMHFGAQSQLYYSNPDMCDDIAGLTRVAKNHFSGPPLDPTGHVGCVGKYFRRFYPRAANVVHLFDLLKISIWLHFVSHINI